eukprot:TRINITY_DN14946_c0_g1_i1.p1 TRINITY_DN14946_c0_g1~~TRINITY_DN14946_c0_g1_i1.p1  ORF type:complete len:130 (-),score=16.21 TRINITY_DN14946_c0_g1_i1:8-355(-)
MRCPRARDEEEKDYYQILGVQRSATEIDIKKAYRRKAFQLFPERYVCAVDDKPFKEASEAYEVLSDLNKRHIYDTHGYYYLKSMTEPPPNVDEIMDRSLDSFHPSHDLNDQFNKR